MHTALKRAGQRRVVIREHRSDLAGQMLLANVNVNLAAVRQLAYTGLLKPKVSAELHAQTGRARRKLRLEIEGRKLERMPL
ncbi:hypothetical protein [Streptomyces sp. NPDC057002]|uniref:hypothetical protein n=1 Tax=Streptomyces sp. NPDC057002 TaxID=3345992 RepID=UPI00362A4A2E